MADELPEKARIALEKAVQQSGSVRLVSKGAKSPGLFPSGAGRDIATAIAQCTASNFLTINEVEEKKGKEFVKVAFAAVTRDGLAALFADVGPERRKEILALASPENRAIAEDAFVATCQAELKTTQAELASLLAKEDELAGQMKSIITHRLSALSVARSRMQQAIEETESYLNELKRIPEKPKTEQPPTPPRKPVPEPKDDRDLDFQRDQSEQLVFAWRDAANDEAKDLLEAVMFNLGLEQLGERGQRIPFDQTTQEIDELVDRGELVEVVHPGWRLNNARGVYLISKTQVRKSEAQ